eukprot:scaffold3851_cov162-Amphora_coffeaeformis.AAC.12
MRALQRAEHPCRYYHPSVNSIVVSLVAIQTLVACPAAVAAKRVPRSLSSDEERSLLSCGSEYEEVLAVWSEDFLQWDDNDSEEIPLYYDSDDDESDETYDLTTRDDDSSDRSSIFSDDDFTSAKHPATPRQQQHKQQQTARGRVDHHQTWKGNPREGGSEHRPIKSVDEVAAGVSVGGKTTSPSKPNLPSTAITAAETTIRTTPATFKVGSTTHRDPTLSSSPSISGMTTWVRRYLSTRPGLLVIPQDFWLDNFNLAQLPPILEAWVQVLPEARGIQFPSGWLYKQALQRILEQDSNATDDSSTNTTTAAVVGVVDDIVEWAAGLLYQLVHQRYALAPRGLEAVRRRFTIWQHQTLKKNPTQPPPYGRCPRTSCRGFALVPSGPDQPSDDKDENNSSRHWRYCGLCQETWRSMSHMSESTEGCSWGTTFGPLFHLTFPYFLTGTQTSPIAGISEPRVFGFRLHPGAVGRISRAE